MRSTARRSDYAFARQFMAATAAKVWYPTTKTLQLEALAQRNVNVHSQLLTLVKARYEAGNGDEIVTREGTSGGL